MLDIKIVRSDPEKVKTAMRNRNKNVDFEVFGCNGDDVTLDLISPRPRTIDLCLNEIAKQTVKRLISRIDNYRKPMATTEIIIDAKIR